MTFKIRKDLKDWVNEVVFCCCSKRVFRAARVVNLTDSEPSGYKNPCVNYSPGNFKGTKLLFWYHSVRWTNDPRVDFADPSKSWKRKLWEVEECRKFSSILFLQDNQISERRVNHSKLRYRRILRLHSPFSRRYCKSLVTQLPKSLRGSRLTIIWDQKSKCFTTWDLP